MSDVVIQSISKSFGSQQVLNDVSFTVQDGHFLSLLGPSGCGKTTLLRIVAGLEFADTGSISIGDQDITGVPVEKRNIGIVFQNYALIPHMTVFNNIAYGLKIRKRPKVEIAAKVKEYLSLVGLEGLADRKIPQLSGGQQQRVALARALIIEPQILLLDEPLSALDRKIRGEMQYEIRRIQQQVGITTLFVTHDQEEAMTMSDEILLMNGGHVEQLSTPQELYNHPVSLYASDFLGKSNTLSGVLRQEKGRLSIQGKGWQFSIPPTEGLSPGNQVRAVIREEDLRLHAAPVEDGCIGEIQSTAFLGSTCRISVSVGSATLFVSCLNIDTEKFRPGQQVYLTAAPERVHCFPEP